jgi:glycosyltransferase involved in cell wall biosynthesis
MPGKVLIISYYWPPSGGAGVQRWLKFAKYLPSTGWIPVVLTVRSEDAAYPFIDDSLCDEVPLDVEVRKTNATNYFLFYSKDPAKIPSGGFANNPGKGFKNKVSRFIRGNFFIPDPRRGWNKYAVKEASSLIREEGISHIITTSPPHSSQLIGLKLKKLFPSITWIADLRDSWTDIYYYNLFYPTFFSKSLDSFYEKKVMQRADKIITVGYNLSKIFSSKAEGAAEKIQVIPNGFDEEDFEGVENILPERFTITYVGTLSEVYPTEALFSALKNVEKSGRDFLLRFVGTIPKEIVNKIREYIDPGKTEFISYTEHPNAIRLMNSSSMLVLVIPNTTENRAITPGKVFEYIATRKPVIYIGPADGDAAYHLNHCGYKGIFSENDSEGMTNFILRNMDAPTEKTAGHHLEYSRRALTNKLAGILNNA